jgi:hypothetical protein
LNIEIQNKYLTIGKKNELCKKIAEESLTYENGMVFEDAVAKKILIDTSILQMYCDVDIGELDLDEVYENGLLEPIKTQLHSEVDFIEFYVDKMIQIAKEKTNTLESIISKNLTILIDKIPDEKGFSKFIKKVSKDLSKINPEILETLKSTGVVK